MFKIRYLEVIESCHSLFEKRDGTASFEAHC